MFRKPGSRAARRADERAAEKLTEQRLKLAAIEPGGTPALPIEVASSSQVEPRAASMPCLVCESPVRVVEHTAETHAGHRVRVVRVRCSRCAKERVVYFRLGSPLPS